MGILNYLFKHFVNTLKSERGDFGGGGDKSSAEQGIQQTGETMYQRGAMTPQEQAQYQTSFGTGQNLQQILMAQLGLGQYPQGYQSPTQQYQNQGPLAQAIYGNVLNQAQNPYAGWESSLQPNLQLATQNVNQQSNQRGLLNSGINLESLGRAGVEAAVADAQNRMTYGQQSLSNAGNLQTGITGLGQTNLQNLGSLYGQQQQSGLTGMQRQAGQAQQAAQYQAYPYEAQLGSIYGQQAGNQSGMYGLGGSLIGAAGAIGSQLPWSTIFGAAGTGAASGATAAAPALAAVAV